MKFISFHRGGRSGFGGPEFGNNRFFGGISDANTKIESVSVEDLLCDPGRKTRPEHLVVILRGLPGSGKSHVAKLLKVNDYNKITFIQNEKCGKWVRHNRKEL